MKKTGENKICAACGESKYFPKWYIDKQEKMGQKNFFCNRICYAGAITGRKLTSAHKEAIKISSIGKLKKGGKYITGRGYVMIYAPLHPYCTSDGYVREHRLVIEANLCRYLQKNEVVHHTNGIKDDNRIENLCLFDSHASHMRVHKNSLKANKY